MPIKKQASALARAAALAIAALTGCATTTPTPEQPDIVVRSKPLIARDGLRFRDANGNGRLDPYED
jgi:beta-glucosidase